jgi:hypothetical protein
MAWTFVETLHDSKLIRNGEHINCIKVAATNDAAASAGTYSLGATATTALLKPYWQGSTLHLLKIVPGTGGDAPTGTFDLDVEDDTSGHILDTDANSLSATTYKAGTTTISAAPPIMTTCTIVIADLGDTNKVDVYLYFWK